MRVNYSRRILAFLVDFFIFYFVAAIIGSVLPLSSRQIELNEQIVELQEKYLNEDVTTEEFITGYREILPKYDKENIILNIINLVFILGYFIIIPVINGGQTLGKKVMRIKIQKKDGNLSIRDMILRNFVTTSLLQLMISSTIIYLVSSDTYFIISLIVSFLQILLVIVTTFMIIYRKDKNGVQDLITKTSVVEVEK